MELSTAAPTTVLRMQLRTNGLGGSSIRLKTQESEARSSALSTAVAPHSGTTKTEKVGEEELAARI